MRQKIANETWQQIKTAYASGIGLREIARNVNIPEGTVLARAKREGWTKVLQSAKALAKREDASHVVTPVEAVALSMQQRGERHVERMAGVSERAVDHIEQWAVPQSSTPLIKSKSSTRLHAGPLAWVTFLPPDSR
jgi:hypothetical protein